MIPLRLTALAFLATGAQGVNAFASGDTVGVLVAGQGGIFRAALNLATGAMAARRVAASHDGRRLQAFKFTDTYTSFRRQLVSFIDYVRSGIDPYPFAETVELMSVLTAGIASKKQGARRVLISEIQSQLS